MNRSMNKKINLAGAGDGSPLADLKQKIRMILNLYECRYRQYFN